MKNNGRKYESYFVEIHYKNGNVENIELDNNMKYRDIQKSYGIINKKYENNPNVSITAFIGRTTNGELKQLSKKLIKIDTKDSLLNKDCRELVKGVFDNVELLSKQLVYHEKMIHKYDKQMDTVRHMIEMSKNDKFKSDEEFNNFKIAMFDELAKLSALRREHKVQHDDIKSIKCQLKGVNLNNLKGFVANRKEFKGSAMDYKSKNELEVYYSNENTKNEHLEKYRNKYDKYIIDECNNSIYFYNNVGIGKLYNNQKQQATNNKLAKNSNRMVG